MIIPRFDVQLRSIDWPAIIKVLLQKVHMQKGKQKYVDFFRNVFFWHFGEMKRELKSHLMRLNVCSIESGYCTE